MLKNSTETTECHECGGLMRRDSRPATLAYKGASVTVEQPGWYCGNCGESVLSRKDAAATEPAYIDLKANAEGLLTAPEIKAVRKKLKLTQSAAGQLLGGGPKAFGKYETRRVLLSRAMNNQLRLLDRHPELLEELADREAV